MTTEYATSPDGVDWTWQGTALRGRPGTWDARGVRISAVVPYGRGGFAYYDGRASAADNWEEFTGIAWSPSGLERFSQLTDGPAATSPHAPGGLRYVTVVEEAEGQHRMFYEGTRPDGAHELRTEVVDLGLSGTGAAA